jgi:hypothetical protein
MKKGGHVKMNSGGKPHEDMPLRKDKRKAKELTTERGIQHEEKGSQKGDFKYARGGSVGDATYHEGSYIAGHRGHGKHVKGAEGQDFEHLHKAHLDHVKGHKAFAHGGVVEKGRKLDRADGGTQKEEKGTQKGEFKYAKGGHVKGFRSAAHGIESKGKTRGRII